MATPRPQIAKELFTTQELAWFLGLAEHTVYRYRYDGIGPDYFYLPNGRVRYRRADVEAWMEGRSVNGRPEHDLNPKENVPRNSEGPSA
jgi:predicted DNA-binding transcriptional regulator AlpA